MFLTACSNSEPQTTTPTPTAQTNQETNASGDNNASADTPKVVKAEGVLGTIAPPNQAATPPQATPAVADTDKAPKIELPIKKLDFGTVRQDKKIIKDFVVKNVGKAPLNIVSVNPG